jgi:hypothetical protein
MNILDTIAQAATNKEVTVHEVVEAYNKGSGSHYKVEDKSVAINMTNVIGSIGGLFLFLGLGFYMSFYWDSFNSIVKLLLSLGIGLLLFYITVYLNNKEPKSLVSNLMIPVSFMWLNWGTYYNLMQSNYPVNTKEWLYILTIAVMAFAYFLLYQNYKKSLFFTAFNLLYVGTWVGLLDKTFRVFRIDFNSYQFYFSLIAIAISGLVIHNFYFKSLNSIVRGSNLSAYYGILMASIIALFARVNINYDKIPKPLALFELLTIIGFIVWYYIAIKTQSRLLIIINSIGLYLWLTYIYTRFFSNFDFGITLIISGLMLIGVSYFTWKLTNNIEGVGKSIDQINNQL